jgi:hypothetical protein
VVVEALTKIHLMAGAQVALAEVVQVLQVEDQLELLTQVVVAVELTLVVLVQVVMV